MPKARSCAKSDDRISMEITRAVRYPPWYHTWSIRRSITMVAECKPDSTQAEAQLVRPQQSYNDQPCLSRVEFFVRLRRTGGARNGRWMATTDSRGSGNTIFQTSLQGSIADNIRLQGRPSDNSLPSITSMSVTDIPPAPASWLRNEYGGPSAQAPTSLVVFTNILLLGKSSRHHPNSA